MDKRNIVIGILLSIIIILSIFLYQKENQINQLENSLKSRFSKTLVEVWINDKLVKVSHNSFYLSYTEQVINNHFTAQFSGSAYVLFINGTCYLLPAGSIIGIKTYIFASDNQVFFILAKNKTKSPYLNDIDGSNHLGKECRYNGNTQLFNLHNSTLWSVYGGNENPIAIALQTFKESVEYSYPITVYYDLIFYKFTISNDFEFNHIFITAFLEVYNKHVDYLPLTFDRLAYLLYFTLDKPIQLYAGDTIRIIVKMIFTG